MVTDLFQGDSTPDYLLTVEFFREVQACLRPGGVVIINTYFDPANEIANDTIVATVTAVFPHVLELRPPLLRRFGKQRLSGGGGHPAFP